MLGVSERLDVGNFQQTQTPDLPTLHLQKDCAVSLPALCINTLINICGAH